MFSITIVKANNLGWAKCTLLHIAASLIESAFTDVGAKFCVNLSEEAISDGNFRSMELVRSNKWTEKTDWYVLKTAQRILLIKRVYFHSSCISNCTKRHSCSLKCFFRRVHFKFLKSHKIQSEINKIRYTLRCCAPTKEPVPELKLAHLHAHSDQAAH